MFDVDAIAVLFMAVYGVVLLVTCVLVLNRRNLQPLKVRDPYLLVSGNIATYVGTFSVSSFVTYQSCWIVEPLALCFVWMQVLVFARFWKLLLAFHLTNVRLSGDISAWILRHSWVASSRRIWTFSLSVIAFLCAIHIAIVVNVPGCTKSDPVTVFNVTLSISWWLSMAAMTFKLRHVKDGFYIASELKMLGCLLLVANIFISAAFQITPSPEIIQFVIMGVSAPQVFIQMWYPLYRSYQMESRATYSPESPPQEHGSPDVSVLDGSSDCLAVLIHPDGFAAMKRFLTLEFSIENLLLWEELEKSLQQTRPEQIPDLFHHIYQVYVQDFSPNEVNVCSNLKSQFRETIKERCTGVNVGVKLQEAVFHSNYTGNEIMFRLLQQLYQDILRLIEEDSFRRFKQTTEYQEMLKTSRLRNQISAKLLNA